MSHFGMIPQRRTVMEYIIISSGGKGRIYIRNPTESFDWKVFTEPLVKDAWIGVALFVFLVPLAMTLVMLPCKLIFNIYKRKLILNSEKLTAWFE